MTSNHPSSLSTRTALFGALGSWRIWTPIGAVFVIFAGLFFASSAPFSIPEVEAACGQAPPDVSFYTSGDDVSNFLDACGASGRRAYQNMQIADLFYPAVFGLFLASSMMLTFSKISVNNRVVVALATLPLVGSAFDYLENSFAWIALANYPSETPTNALLGWASAAKTTTFWVSGILLLGGLGVVIVQRISRKDNPTTRHREPSHPVDGRPTSA